MPSNNLESSSREQLTTSDIERQERIRTWNKKSKTVQLASFWDPSRRSLSTYQQFLASRREKREGEDFNEFLGRLWGRTEGLRTYLAALFPAISVPCLFGRERGSTDVKDDVELAALGELHGRPSASTETESDDSEGDEEINRGKRKQGRGGEICSEFCRFVRENIHRDIRTNTHHYVPSSSNGNQIPRSVGSLVRNRL